MAGSHRRIAAQRQKRAHRPVQRRGARHLHQAGAGQVISASLDRRISDSGTVSNTFGGFIQGGFWFDRLSNFSGSPDQDRRIEMKMQKMARTITALGLLGAATCCHALQTYRLYEGLTAYVNNPGGKEFTVNLDVRDLNLFANGPREILFKVYDPDGQPAVREIIPDDGVISSNFPDRIGGWDHELQYYANLYELGTVPSFRWSAWSDPARMETIVKRTFTRKIKGGKKGVYRIVLAGTQDNYVTLRLSPDLNFGVCGQI